MRVSELQSESSVLQRNVSVYRQALQMLSDNVSVAEHTLHETVSMMRLLSDNDTVIVSDDHIWRHLNISRIQRIPLSVRSHQGHLNDDGKYAPEHMLRVGNVDYYFSKNGVMRDDWVELSVDDEALWFPIKIAMRTYDGRSSVKSFRLLMGSSESGEWMQLGERPFFAKMSNELQAFYLPIDNDKYHTVTTQPSRFREFKLEIQSNHGWEHGIYVKEFMLFGVRV